MKKYIIILIAIVFAGCYEDAYVDPTIMPEETASGENTFGCLIDGWLYVGGRYNDVSIFIFDVEVYDSIRFSYSKEEDTLYVAVKVTSNDFIRFHIENPRESRTCRLSNIQWKNERLADCEGYITRFDRKAQIISGRFSGGRIEHGRFDVVYAEFE